MSTPFSHEPGTIQVDLDKPRRGQSARFWPEIITDDDLALGSGDAALVEMISAATQPARDYLAAQGRPTDRLLIRWPAYSRQPKVGLGRRRTEISWMPDGPSLDFRRLRRSVPGRGVGREPTDHSPTTHLHYVRTDSESLEEKQVEAANGIEAAVNRAAGEVRMRMLRNSDARIENDALVANCADPEAHPKTKTPCTTGFYSFLLCLECDNAATVARLLPAQLATLQVLDGLRGSTADWGTRFAHSYQALQAVVSRHTAIEVADAEPLVAAHIPRVLAALRIEVP